MDSIIAHPSHYESFTMSGTGYALNGRLTFLCKPCGPVPISASEGSSERFWAKRWYRSSSGPAPGRRGHPDAALCIFVLDKTTVLLVEVARAPK